MQKMKHVRIGVMKVGELGALLDRLAPYAGHSCQSHVLARAVRFTKNQPLIGPTHS
nr:hypothetical protein [uncultured Halomonas sp.]